MIEFLIRMLPLAVCWSILWLCHWADVKLFQSSCLLGTFVKLRPWISYSAVLQKFAISHNETICFPEINYYLKWPISLCLFLIMSLYFQFLMLAFLWGSSLLNDDLEKLTINTFASQRLVFWGKKWIISPWKCIKYDTWVFVWEF